MKWYLNYTQIVLGLHITSIITWHYNYQHVNITTIKHYRYQHPISELSAASITENNYQYI